MRLSADEIAAIKECAARHFGDGAVVRLFGSRLRDDFEGGDVDLHVTTDSDGVNCAREFQDELEERLSEDVDVHVIGQSGSRRPIDQIAILTGEVVAGPWMPPAHDPDLGTRSRVMRDAYREMIGDAIDSGRRVRRRLTEVLEDLMPKLPFDEDRIRSLSRLEELSVDSLLLQYRNLVVIIQDQLVRTLLLEADGVLPSRRRDEHRQRAQAIGMLPADIDFKAIADARNSVAHNYPGLPAKQASAINRVVEALPAALRAFEALTRYAEARGLVPPQ